LAANARADAGAAETLVLMGSVQAAVNGRDPHAIDRVVADLEAARKRAVIDVSETQARQAVALAGKALVDACQAVWDQQLAQHPEYRMPGPSPCSKEGSRMTASQRQRLIEAENASRDGGGDLVRQLASGNATIAAVADGSAALAKGDYLGAAKSALKLVPKSTAVGAAVHGALALLGGG